MSAPLYVVRGAPTPEELAAALVVLTARTAAPAPTATPPARPLWAVPTLRTPLVPGPGAWRASALPR